jgi:hypothetical protein
MTNFKFVVLGLAFLVAGCAAPTPFRELVSTGNPNASRISINSTRSTIYHSETFLPGKVYIDGVFYGEFSSSQKEFTAELLPGPKLIVVCPESDRKCVNLQLNVQPNKHYRYRYTVETQYLVIAANLIWRLIPLSVENYQPAIASGGARVEAIGNQVLLPQTSQGSTPPTVNGSADAEMEKKMMVGRERCVALGFQSGTQSFGECILRLTK